MEQTSIINVTFIKLEVKKLVFCLLWYLWELSKGWFVGHSKRMVLLLSFKLKAFYHNYYQEFPLSKCDSKFGLFDPGVINSSSVLHVTMKILNLVSLAYLV